jgi:prepilin-type N-terminal cleavage/methylation domain-containing protein
MNRQRAFTIAEVVVAMAIGSLILGAIFLSFISLQKSFVGSSQYATNVTASARLLDYLSMDLRRALRVNQGVATMPNPLRGAGVRYVITDANILSITVPDYYANNASSNSAYRTARYPYPGDPNYDATNSYGQVKFADATQVIKNKYVIAFSPSSAPDNPTDELEVRYQRTTRALHDPTGSAGDRTVCIFRQEFKNGVRVSALSREEIAEAVEVPLTSSGAQDLTAANNLSITSQNADGAIFLVQFAFTSRLNWAPSSQNASVVGSGASTVVALRNRRRD